MEHNKDRSKTNEKFQPNLSIDREEDKISTREGATVQWDKDMIQLVRWEKKKKPKFTRP